MVYSSMLSGRLPVNTALPSSERLRLQAFLAKNKHKALERQLENQLKELKIDSPQRLKDVWIKKEIIKNRKEITKKEEFKPIALIIYPKKEEDNKRAYENNDIEGLISAGYKVIYFEAAYDHEVAKCIIEVGKYNKINFLVIGGHGLPLSMNLSADGKEKNLTNAQELYLDGDDLLKLKKQNLKKYFYENSLGILESCEAGLGGANAKNMVNMMHEVLGINVIGPETETALGKYIFDANGRVVSENFSCGKDKIYFAGNSSK